MLASHVSEFCFLSLLFIYFRCFSVAAPEPVVFIDRIEISKVRELKRNVYTESYYKQKLYTGLYDRFGVKFVVTQRKLFNDLKEKNLTRIKFPNFMNSGQIH